MQDAASAINIKEGEKVGKWWVIKQLGRGTYGAVYKVMNDIDKREGAMKVESRNLPREYHMLKVEVQVMRELREKSCKNCVRIIDAGQTPVVNYLVMDLVGPNLETLANRLAREPNRTGVFTPYTLFHTALETIEAIIDLHAKLYLHRDVKPQNFAVGCHSSDYKTVYMLDFGTARRYARETGLHHWPRAKVAFRGSTPYASASALMQVEQSRRDDVWSWFFMMIRLAVGTLPWSHLENMRATNYEKYLENYADFKDGYIDKPEELLRGCPPEFIPIWENLRTLLFYSRPDYNLIIQKVKDGLQRAVQESPKARLDWESIVRPQDESVSSRKMKTDDRMLRLLHAMALEMLSKTPKSEDEK